MFAESASYARCPPEGVFCQVVLQMPGADLERISVIRKRPALFRRWHFEDGIILLCVRWYLRYSLTYRDLKQMMAERRLALKTT